MTAVVIDLFLHHNRICIRIRFAGFGSISETYESDDLRIARARRNGVHEAHVVAAFHSIADQRLRPQRMASRKSLTMPICRRAGRADKTAKLLRPDRRRDVAEGDHLWRGLSAIDQMISPLPARHALLMNAMHGGIAVEFRDDHQQIGLRQFGRQLVLERGHAGGLGLGVL